MSENGLNEIPIDHIDMELLCGHELSWGELLDLGIDDRVYTFMRKYQHLFCDAESCWETERGDQLIFELQDGRLYLYDVYGYRIVKIQWIDSVTEFTEDEWRRGFVFFLREMLSQRRMPQYTFAESIGVTESMLSRYLSERATPSSYVLHKMADVLDCTVDELLPKIFIPSASGLR